MASQQDVSTTINFGKNADNTAARVTAVEVGGATLTAGTDFTLVNNTLTIKKEYLATKVIGPLEISVEFSAGMSATLTVNVLDTTDYTVNSTVSPITSSFDKNTDSQSDVTTTINFGKNPDNTAATVKAVKVGSVTIINGADYTLIGDTLTLKKEYLATKEVGPLVISVEFTAGTNATFTINVADTTDYTTNSTISPITSSFDKKTGSQSDVTTTVNFGKNADNTVSNVTAVKVGDATLIVDKDYTVVDNNLTLKKEYLAKQPKGKVIVSVEFSAGTAAQLTINIKDTTVPVSIISKPIQSLDFSTKYATPAMLVGKPLMTSQFAQTPKNFSLEVETAEGTKILPINLNWNLSTEVPWGDGISGVINSQAQMKFGFYDIPLVSWKNSNDEKAFNIVTYKAGSAVKIKATGSDASYFFEELSAQGTDEDSTKNRNFTVSDGTNTATISLATKFNTIDQLVNFINNRLINNSVAVLAEKVNETQFKFTSEGGTLVIDGSHKANFFE